MPGGGQSSLSSITGIGAGSGPFRAAGKGTIKRGFTLAEVLITLGIIGVVAAMTLPSITASKQREELKASLKKNYSIIQQVFLHLASDNGGSLRPADIGGWTLKKDMMKYMKVLKDCGYGTLEADACVSNMYNNPELSSTKYKTFDGRLISSLTYFDDGQFILSDGSFYMLENNKGSIYITVDVNGINKNPNQWGYDLFTFQLTDKGKLLPMGAEGTDYTDDTYCSKSSTDKYNGIACANKAISDKDYWKNL